MRKYEAPKLEEILFSEQGDILTMSGERGLTWDNLWENTNDWE